MGIFGPKRKKIAYSDPSDALIYLCGLDGQEQKTLGDIILAFQGGGLLDTEKSVEIARRPPSQDQQLEMKDTAIAIIECFDASNLSNMGQGFAHGMFITSMTDMLSVDMKKVSPLQKAIASGTINAMAQLVAAKNHELALTVGLCGQVLLLIRLLGLKSVPNLVDSYAAIKQSDSEISRIYLHQLHMLSNTYREPLDVYSYRWHNGQRDAVGWH